MAFVKEVAAWDTNKFKSVGLGDDFRLERGQSSGTALVVDGEVVHSVAFIFGIIGNLGCRIGLVHPGKPRRELYLDTE